MSTSLPIERNDVLMVPNRAVRTVGRQKMATVLFEGRTMQVPIVTGMSGDSQTEIVSGLKEGDVVVIGTTTTAQNGGFGGRVVRVRPVMVPARTLSHTSPALIPSQRARMGEVENDRDRERLQDLPAWVIAKCMPSTG